MALPQEVGALTTCDSAKWIVGDCPGKVWGDGRPLTINERIKCVGMEPASLAGINYSDVLRMLGNTIPVNSIGGVVAAIMEVYVPWEQKCFLPAFAPSLGIGAYSGAEIWEEILPSSPANTKAIENNAATFNASKRRKIELQIIID